MACCTSRDVTPTPPLPTLSSSTGSVCNETLMNIFAFINITVLYRTKMAEFSPSSFVAPLSGLRLQYSHNANSPTYCLRMKASIQYRTLLRHDLRY